MVRIDGQRLIADLRALAAIGKCGTGVHRLAFSAEDIEARRWVLRKLADAGLDAAMDRVGTVIGRSRAPGPAVLIGSHTDTVPRGGWLDGALGVVYGIEIARAFAESPDTRDLAIDVVDFQDEEGTHFPCLGSRLFCGELTAEQASAVKAAEGGILADLIARQGLADHEPARLEAGRYRAFLEAHIEQGPRLESGRTDIGVVSAIVGIRRYRVLFTGRADHAGTTPMSMRRDAGARMIDFAHALQGEFRRLAAADTVWNFGRVVFEPGAANVVPRTAELAVEFRDTDAAVLDRFEQRLAELVAEAKRASAVEVEANCTADIPPIAMDAAVADTIAAAAEALVASSVRMPSGAGHDAMILARYVPSGMLFVPSIGGRSHDVAEDTAEADIIRGCQVLAAAAERLLRDG